MHDLSYIYKYRLTHGAKLISSLLSICDQKNASFDQVAFCREFQVMNEFNGPIKVLENNQRFI